MKTLTLTRPDDFHLHVRHGALLAMVIAHSAKQFARAMIMPNLKPPVVNVQQAEHYRQEILTALPPEMTFNPLMTLYLTELTIEIKDKSQLLALINKVSQMEGVLQVRR